MIWATTAPTTADGGVGIRRRNIPQLAGSFDRHRQLAEILVEGEEYPILPHGTIQRRPIGTARRIAANPGGVMPSPAQHRDGVARTFSFARKRTASQGTLSG
jgi:hypothetical protein